MKYTKFDSPYLWVPIQVFSLHRVRQLLSNHHWPVRYCARNWKLLWELSSWANTFHSSQTLTNSHSCALPQWYHWIVSCMHCLGNPWGACSVTRAVQTSAANGKMELAAICVLSNNAMIAARTYLILGFIACTAFVQCRWIEVFVFVFILIFAKFFAEWTLIFVPNLWMLDHRSTKHDASVATIWCRPQYLQPIQCTSVAGRWSQMERILLPESRFSGDCAYAWPSYRIPV